MNPAVLDSTSHRPSPRVAPRNERRGVGGFFFRWFDRIRTWLVAAAFCTTYFGSVFVVGWAYRWIRGKVLYAWWKQSPLCGTETFADFCDRAGRDNVTDRPRWILRESSNVAARSTIGRILRLFSHPWHSLWRNFRTGIGALFCTYVLTGSGCLLMWLGWRYGWQVSFHKGYEEYTQDGLSTGMIISFLGILLFVLSMYYTLMAQVHHAVTGDRGAFFDFRFVSQLVRARPLAYCSILLLIAVFSIPTAVMSIAVLGPNFAGNSPEISAAEAVNIMVAYVYICCLVFFPMWLLTRRLLAATYAASVLAVLRNGTFTVDELHPQLQHWLRTLDVVPTPVLSAPGILTFAQSMFRTAYRWTMFGSFFLVLGLWTFFTFHVGEFFVYHPVYGLMNQEFVQFPTMGIIPYRLIGEALAGG